MINYDSLTRSVKFALQPGAHQKLEEQVSFYNNHEWKKLIDEMQMTKLELYNEIAITSLLYGIHSLTEEPTVKFCIALAGTVSLSTALSTMQSLYKATNAFNRSIQNFTNNQ